MLHLDLCSGIGGFALAARWHGMKTIGFCEIDPWCRRVLDKNFPGVPQHDDVTTLDGRTVRQWAGGRPVSVLTAGYPCQPFSLAGKRMGEQDDRHLWPYIAALVADLRPAWCLFENVAGHIALGLDRVLADLEEIGYACRPVVVPACAVGAPHRRDRVWIIAAHTDRKSESVVSRNGDAGRGFVGTQTLAHAERSGWREQLQTDSAQESLSPTVGGEGAPWFGSGGEVMADSARELFDRSGRTWDRRSEYSDRRDTGRALHNTDSGRHGTSDELVRSGRDSAVSADRREAQPGLGESLDGLSRQLARPWDGEWECGVPRVTAGCPDRVNKLKALGNAIVPQVAYVLMGAMFQEYNSLSGSSVAGRR